jgi:NADH-quinone oxidoreductase subunit J
MVAELILFFGLAIVAVASAVGMIMSKSAVYSALNLIINFITVAIFYVTLGAPFIALTQVAVYAGAIMVLFLFVIMLLGAEQLGGVTTPMPWQRPTAFVLAILLVILMAYTLVTHAMALPQGGDLPAGFGTPAAVGALLYSTYLLPFEVISVLLLVAMLGAIILSKKQDRKT